MSARSLQVREISATPAQLRALVALHPERFPALFDSTAIGPLGRHSCWRRCRAARCCCAVTDGSNAAAWSCAAAIFSVRSMSGGGRSAQRAGAAAGPPDLPFRGGWMIYLGYELAERIEPGLHLPALSADAVCAMAIRVSAALVYDHAAARCQLVVEADAAAAGGEIDQLRGRCRRPRLAATPGGLRPGAASEQDPEVFRAAVLRAQEHIARGDIYQANLSRGWRVQLDGSPDPGAAVREPAARQSGAVRRLRQPAVAHAAEFLARAAGQGARSRRRDPAHRRDPGAPWGTGQR